MDKSKFGTNQEAHLDPQYHNGQSDAEKLMHQHLHATEGALTDKELESIQVTTGNTTSEIPPDTDDKKDDSESDRPSTIITPLDVLGG